MAGKMTATALNSPISAGNMTDEIVHAYLSGDTDVSGTYYTQLDIEKIQNVDKYSDPNAICCR